MFYHLGMEHLEVHIITSEYAAELAYEAGLLDDEDIDLTCDNCDTNLGSAETTYQFTPFCIAMNDSELWFVCLDCASPLVYPAG